MNNSKSDNTTMAPVECFHHSSIGVDVHSKVLVCCAQRYDPVAKTLATKNAKFPTTVTGLLEFAAWCFEFDPEIILMESTGVYWLSPFEALEDAGIDSDKIAVVKATDVKAALGRKTDKEDARRLAEFARIGTIRKSYVPPREFREARRLARSYQKALSKRTSAICQLHKTFCSLGCRPGTVFSDITGKTATTIITSYINDTPEDFTKTVMASRKLKATREEILDVFAHITPAQRRELRIRTRAVENCEREAAEFMEMLEETLRPYEHLVQRLTTIPGIKRVSALKILSELGPDLGSFENSRAFCSWMGVCPGNHESAGKRYGSSTPKGSPYIKTYLVEAAQAVGLMKLQTNNLRKFLQAVKERRGHNRAMVAVAHKIARIIYALFKNDADYVDIEDNTLGAVRVKRFNQSVRNLAQLGVKLNVSIVELPVVVGTQ